MKKGVYGVFKLLNISYKENMIINLLIAITVFMFLTIFVIVITKKELLVNIYNILKDNIPGYAKITLYIAIIILIIFLIVFEILKYFNINLLNF